MKVEKIFMLLKFELNLYHWFKCGSSLIARASGVFSYYHGIGAGDRVFNHWDVFLFMYSLFGVLLSMHVKSPIHEGGCHDPLIYINVMSFSNTSSLLCFQ